MDLQGQNGLLHTQTHPAQRGGLWGAVLAVLLTGFYVALYFESDLVTFGVPPLLSRAARALSLDSRWTLYSILYSLAMCAGAYVYLRKHGNSRYNRARIAVNVAVQLVLAFALPLFMQWALEREFYVSYLWPLKIEYFYPSELAQYPVYIGLYSIVASLLVLPWATFRYGKRVYCSWICGCGGLANTFGDPFRHLTSKSERAHRFERFSVHLVLVLALTTTLLVVLDYFVGAQHSSLHAAAGEVRKSYAFVIGAVLSGVIGVGVYPLLGPRVWCRNFCPMAAMLGLIQKLGRFEVRVQRDMCISCGNCSSYCEMGIDVRAYAERNESFTRAACVGCGACAHVCPRGVLRVQSAPARRALPIAR